MQKQLTNEQILKKVIEKAIKNGYKAWWVSYYLRGKNHIKVVLKFRETLEGLIIQFTDKGDVDWDDYCKGGLIDWRNGYVLSVIKAETLVFSHDFAKAFWKDAEWEWKHYLQEMVLEENPIKYLEQFICKNN
jgi:hypothetical protein